MSRTEPAPSSHRTGRGDRVPAYAFAIDRFRRRFYTRPCEPVAQMVEHLTFNQVVLGSSPSGLTRIIRENSNMAARSCRRAGRQLPISRIALPNLDRDLFRNP